MSGCSAVEVGSAAARAWISFIATWKEFSSSSAPRLYLDGKSPSWTGSVTPVRKKLYLSAGGSVPSAPPKLVWRLDASERPESSKGTHTALAGAPTAAPNSLLDTLAGWQPSAGTSFQQLSATPSSV